MITNKSKIIFNNPDAYNSKYEGIVLSNNNGDYEVMVTEDNNVYSDGILRHGMVGKIAYLKESDLTLA